MNISAAFAVAAVLGLSGCVSTTRSYDANGNLLGSCSATRAFFLGSDAICTGSSNPKDQGEAVPIIPRRPDPQAAKCPEGQDFKYGQCYPASPMLRSK